VGSSWLYEEGSVEDPDPQPGEFDEELATIDPGDVQIVEAGSSARVTIAVNADSDQAKRLGEIAI
jgi:preprotein translocase subunit SecF